MYEGLKSKGLKKRSLPPKFKDPADIELLTHERTTGGDEFSYLLRLTGPDRYFLLLKFIEVGRVGRRWCTRCRGSGFLRCGWGTRWCSKWTSSRRLGQTLS